MNMEYLISEGSRVAYFGTGTRKHQLAFVESISKRKGGTEAAGIRFSPTFTLYTDMKNLRPIFVDDSIPNGVNLTDCCLRPFENPDKNYMPDSAIGNPYRISEVYKEGVVVEIDDEEYGDNYFLAHDTYHIIPNYKNAWVWKGTELVYEEVMFKFFTGEYLQWESCETGELLKDRVVLNNITEGLEFGRKIMQNSSIKVKR